MEQRRFAVIRETVSPRGRYALAWGARGRTDIDWKRMEAGGEYADRVLGTLLRGEDPDYNEIIENYLIDRRADTILARIQPVYRTYSLPGEKPTRYKAGGGYWQVGNHGPNHDSLTAKWLADESLATLLYHGKWAFEAVYLLERTAGGFRQAEVRGVAEAFVREYLRRNQAQEFRAADDGRKLAISAEIQALSADRLTLGISAGVPKSDNPMFDGVLTLGILRTGRTLTVRPLSLRKS